MAGAAALAALHRASLASLVTVGFVITLIVSPAAARLPAPGWSAGRGFVGAFGDDAGAADGRLLRLRGGSGAQGETLPPPSPVASMPEAETPLDAAKEGLAHMGKEDWANAIASFTRGLEIDNDQPEFKVALHFNRAKALFLQGAWVEAGEDARRGLAFCDVLEADSSTVLGLKPLLEKIALDAEGVPVEDVEVEVEVEDGKVRAAMAGDGRSTIEHEAMAEARSDTEEVGVAPSTIEADSPVGE